VRISPDGKEASAKPVTIESGRVAFGSGPWEAGLVDGRKILCVSGHGGPVAVPAGKYTLLYYRERSAPNAKGQRACFLSMSRDFITGKAEGKRVSVAPGRTTKLAIGSPLSTGLEVREGPGRTVKVSMKGPKTRGGLLVAFITPPSGWIGTLPQAPKVVIRNPQGKVVYQCALEYG